MIDNRNRSAEAPAVAVAVDLVIFTVRDSELQVLLIERGKEPFFGLPALPGGYVRANETLDEAAERELAEETGIDGRRLHLEQLRTYGDPKRDPRGRVITVAYLALGPDLPRPVAGTDARAARWTPAREVIDSVMELAFDHSVILHDALERARSQLEYTTVAAAFCPEPFTISDLRHVYEAVWGIPLDPSNFRRKVTRARQFLEPTGHRRLQLGRPAALYRRGGASQLFPPLLRSSDIAGPLGTDPAPRSGRAGTAHGCPLPGMRPTACKPGHMICQQFNTGGSAPTYPGWTYAASSPFHSDSALDRGRCERSAEPRPSFCRSPCPIGKAGPASARGCHRPGVRRPSRNATRCRP